MAIKLQWFNYECADNILSSKKETMLELEKILTSLGPISELSRPAFNKKQAGNFKRMGWKRNTKLLDPPNERIMKVDYMRNRVQVEIESGHPSFIGTDLLKFQLASCYGKNLADIGVYVVPTESFMSMMISQYNKKWDGSFTFEKATKSIDSFKTVIQCPIQIVGIDFADEHT